MNTKYNSTRVLCVLKLRVLHWALIYWRSLVLQFKYGLI